MRLMVGHRQTGLMFSFKAVALHLASTLNLFHKYDDLVSLDGMIQQVRVKENSEPEQQWFATNIGITEIASFRFPCRSSHM